MATVTVITDGLIQLEDSIHKAVGEALKAYSEIWLDKANSATPVDTGQLRDSNQVELAQEDTDLLLANEQEYASFVADHSGNWIEDTFSEEELSRMMDEEIAKEGSKD